MTCLDDDVCPGGFGPGGEWRAALAEVEEAARHDGELGNLKRVARAINAAGAAGWLA